MIKKILYLVVALSALAINMGSILPWIISNDVLPMEVMIPLAILDVIGLVMLEGWLVKKALKK